MGKFMLYMEQERRVCESGTGQSSHTQVFSKVLYLSALYSNCTGALTFENLCQACVRDGNRLLASIPR